MRSPTKLKATFPLRLTANARAWILAASAPGVRSWLGATLRLHRPGQGNALLRPPSWQAPLAFLPVRVCAGCSRAHSRNIADRDPAARGADGPGHERLRDPHALDAVLSVVEAEDVALPNDVALCHELIRQQADSLDKAQRRIEQLEHAMDVLLLQRYGPRLRSCRSSTTNDGSSPPCAWRPNWRNFGSWVVSPSKKRATSLVFPVQPPSEPGLTLGPG